MVMLRLGCIFRRARSRASVRNWNEFRSVPPEPDIPCGKQTIRTISAEELFRRNPEYEIPAELGLTLTLILLAVASVN